MAPSKTKRNLRIGLHAPEALSISESSAIGLWHMSDMRMGNLQEIGVMTNERQ